ncbi:hypothetical protein POM88_049173 [Heracleum sosnowskyi]|uniref:Uncharacterized protein n=1 Tax=Heracleum sosnowskyi TaxID=360622 RepID=A0AAD8GXA4_9APIA|nr:hypothetical protein POM88_049173 [Heracleum sosnowskyi]
MPSSQMGAQMSCATGEVSCATGEVSCATGEVSQKLQMPAPMEQAPGPSTTSENLKSVTYDMSELIEAFCSFLPHPPKEDEASTLDDVIDYINTTHAEIPQLEEQLSELQSEQQSILTAGMQFEATATEGDYNIPDSPIFGLVEMPNQMVGIDVVPAIGSPVNHAAEAASAFNQVAIVNQAAEAASVVNQAPIMNQAALVMNQAAAVVNQPAVENPDAVGVTATVEELVAFGHCTAACDNVELMQERTKGCPVYSLDTCDDDDDFAEPVPGVGTRSKKRRRDAKVGSSFVGGTKLDATCKKKLALRKKVSSTSAKCEEKKKKSEDIQPVYSKEILTINILRGRASSLISPLMVRHMMSENTETDAISKWNFLMLMYNFFIESNQNAFLLRDVLRFSGNIDECGSYVERFKRNVIELKEGYKRCVTDYVTVLALFPRNAKVEELKEEYPIFFKVFDELSPISKKLANCNAIDNAVMYSAIKTEEEDLPSFSLGLSQNICRNLGFEFGTVAQSYRESHFCTKMSEDEYRAGGKRRGLRK